MNLPVTIPDSLAIPIDEIAAFGDFFQRMTNRRAQGYARYGTIARRQRYMSRMKKEIEALESYTPENRKYHFKPDVESVTRKE